MLDFGKKKKKKKAKDDLLKEADQEQATTSAADKENVPAEGGEGAAGDETEDFGKKKKKTRVKFDDDQTEVIEVCFKSLTIFLKISL